MQKSFRYIIGPIFVMILIMACDKDEPEPESCPIPSTNVHFDLAKWPFQKLSDYRFFIDTISHLKPNDGVLPYDVITPLFSDYAKKKRFIWMPDGRSANYVNDYTVLNFPEGTVMIKNFYYDHVLPDNKTKLVETRLIYLKNGEWEFADYVWNEAQTEAYFDLDGSYQTIVWMDDGGASHEVNYRIPSEVECYTCHKFNEHATPIGPKPQNLNKAISYSTGLKNQLDKWIEMGYLTPNLPNNIETVADWTDVNESIQNRWRAYVDMNCGHCHREGSHCDYRSLRLAWNETTNPDHLGICVTPEEPLAAQLTHIIARSNVNRSMMYYRLNTTEEQYRMPLFGRTVIHQEAVTLLNEYINSLNPTCP